MNRTAHDERGLALGAILAEELRALHTPDALSPPLDGWAAWAEEERARRAAALALPAIEELRDETTFNRGEERQRVDIAERLRKAASRGFDHVSLPRALSSARNAGRLRAAGYRVEWVTHNEPPVSCIKVSWRPEAEAEAPSEATEAAT